MELGDFSGRVVKSYEYDAYGNILQETGPSVPGGLTYTSRQYHSRSGLYYYRARWYDPELGRFLTQDPLGWPGGINLYEYALNDPVNCVDPYGLTIVVKGDLSAYWQAIGYLNRDPGMSTIIRDLTLSSTTYTVIFNNTGVDSYNHSTHEIHWDPNSALRFVLPGGGTGTQSPALGLGHEMAHADGPWYWVLLIFRKCPQYDNLEERRVISGAETDAARTLGEDIRNSHGGMPFFVPTPISR